ISADYSPPLPPPQGHTHSQYYGFLLPEDSAMTWHETYCRKYGIDLRIPHPIYPGQFLELNSLPVALRHLGKKINCRLYNEPVYTNDHFHFKETSICIGFAEYPQRDLPHTTPYRPTKTEYQFFSSIKLHSVRTAQMNQGIASLASHHSTSA
ncbi:hypothetical protein BDQ12DRAFT_694131, partial [Crucibulum laeve]